MVTTSLLLFCLFSFLTQSIDAFRIAPAIFRFPGEMPWGSPRSFPSPAGESSLGYELFPTLQIVSSSLLLDFSVLIFDSSLGAISSTPSRVVACPPTILSVSPVLSVLSTFPT